MYGVLIDGDFQRVFDEPIFVEINKEKLKKTNVKNIAKNISNKELHKINGNLHNPYNYCLSVVKVKISESKQYFKIGNKVYYGYNN